MKNITCIIISLGLLAGACEKNSDDSSRPPTYIEVPGIISDRDSLLAADAGLAQAYMLIKAVEFRTALTGSGKKRAGIYVYSSSIQACIDHPKRLAARLALLGFTDVYLSAARDALNGTDAGTASWLKTFIEQAHACRLAVHALRYSNTQMYVADDKIYEDADLIKTFNASAVNPAQRFDAVSGDLEPHILKKDGADTPAGLTSFWDSDNNYGIGRDNDILLKRTLDILQLARREIAPLTLSNEYTYLYQQKINEKQLQHGDAKDFLTYCDHIITMCYFNRTDVVWNRAQPVLSAALNHPESVYVAIKTSLNTYGDEGIAASSLQPQGWKYLLQTLDYLHENTRNMPSMRGICIFEYEGLEEMWKWVNDKD
jgi:hypothetical protein